MSKIRLGHLIKGLGRGGAESLLPQMIRAGSGRFEHHVAYALPWKDALVPELESLATSVECLGAAGSLALLGRTPAVRRWIRRHDLQLLHCHLPLTGAVGRLAARGTSVPVVYTEHNLQARYRRATRWLNRATWRMQDQVVAVSGQVKDSIHLEIGRAVPVQVVHNGIEPVVVAAGDAARLREELGLPGECSVVGTIAVFRVQKRLDHWLRAARLIHDRRPDTRFVLVGDGPEMAKVVAMRERLDLADVVSLPGLRSDVAGFLGLFDVFMLSSEFEGLPLAVLEAMSAATAVVATRAGGVPEAITDRVTGRLVEVGAVGALAAAVADVLESGEQCALGRRARDHVVRSFSSTRMAGDLEGLYDRILGGGDRSPDGKS